MLQGNVGSPYILGRASGQDKDIKLAPDIRAKRILLELPDASNNYLCNEKKGQHILLDETTVH